MKNSILLIEDRPTRQHIFFQDLKTNLNDFSLLKNVCGGDEFYLFKEKISNDISFFDDYNVIMIHRSALTPEERASLIGYVDGKSKILIFFSGGISSTLIQKIGRGQLLTINSKDFYSVNLVLFLENSGKEILELAFGKDWKLNLLIGVHEKVSLYVLNYDKAKPIQIVLDDMVLPQWIKDKYINIESGLVEKDQLISINETVHTDIKKLLR